MPGIESILLSAQQLSVGERLELIDALWATVPTTALPPLTDEWLAEKFELDP